MTRSIERSPLEVPLFGPVRYPVESGRDRVIDEEKGAIIIERHVVPHLCHGDEPALLIANGWGEGCDTLRTAASELAQAGREVFTFNHRRTQAATGNPEMYKSSTLETVFRAVAAEQPVTIIAHSEGAISSVRMVRRLIEQDEAGQVGGLSLVAPAGITGIQRPDVLMRRGTLEMAQHIFDVGSLRALGRSGLLSVMMYALPVNLNLKELGYIAKTDLTDDIRLIAEAGVPVGIIGCTKDRLFAIKDLRQKATELADSGVAYDEVSATHIQFLTKPQVVRAILAQVGSLEEGKGGPDVMLTNLQHTMV